jgi:transposase
MSSAFRIVLTREERTRLESLATDTCGPRALRKRAQAILICGEGKTNLEIANEIGMTNFTVGRWRREFLLNRLTDFGVERRGRPVRPLILSCAELKTLQRWSQSPRVYAGLATRARVILTCAQGANNIAVARATGVSTQTASKLRRRFLSKRLLGLGSVEPARPAVPSYGGSLKHAKVQEQCED